MAGTKRFRIFDPANGAALAPFPFHHPMDRSAQADLAHARSSATHFPRMAEARGSEVCQGPGDALFLPAYWWHEVITDDTGSSAGTGQPASGQPLTVSVNFWFSAHAHLSDPAPALPLRPMLEAELSRQLEMAVADALSDRGELVPPFLRAMRRQLEATLGATLGAGAVGPKAAGWAALQRQRPAGVAAGPWAALFEHALARLMLWLPTPAHVLPFLRRHCCDSRFARLPLR